MTHDVRATRSQVLSRQCTLCMVVRLIDLVIVLFSLFLGDGILQLDLLYHKQN